MCRRYPERKSMITADEPCILLFLLKSTERIVIMSQIRILAGSCESCDVNIVSDVRSGGPKLAHSGSWWFGSNWSY
jgi:hypothetical protein